MAKILVIDDCESVRDFIGCVLNDAGYDVYEAENGTKGLETFSVCHPDCVLLDIIMPDIDGLEVLNRIRKDSDETPVLLMTGHDPDWAERCCKQYGASGFLHKVIDAETLLERVEEVILDAESDPRRKESRSPW